MNAKDKPVVSARVYPQLLKRLDRYCQKHHLSRQDVIEKALNQFLR